MDQKQQIALEVLAEAHEKKLAAAERLRNELESLEADLAHLKASIHLLKEQSSALEAISAAMSFNLVNLAKPKDIAGLVVPDPPPISPERLHGLSQPRAMVVIAKHYGGYLRTKDLTKILIKAGLMKLTKNSQSIASRLIRESERFERITDGFYKLKNIESPATQEADAALENRVQ
jgi:hypothetical protein